MTSDTPTWLWVTFATLTAVLIAVDLFVHRGGRGADRRTALRWTGVWIAVGIGFSGLVYLGRGGAATEQYLAAYLIEKALSLDNMFVFLIIFGTLRIRDELQHNVLAWGVIGALAFRALFIFAGMEALERFSWVTYVFGGLLFVAAFHAVREDPVRGLEGNDDAKVVRWLQRHLRVTDGPRGTKFLVREGGVRRATPLLVALLAIELTDVVFAVDSVPAALSMSRDRFVVYSSNAFAIMGLRSLYLALASLLTDLRYLHYGLGAVLAFAGFKLVSHRWIHVPPLVSVGIIGACIGVAVLASLWATRREARGPHAEPLAG